MFVTALALDSMLSSPKIKVKVKGVLCLHVMCGVLISVIRKFGDYHSLDIACCRTYYVVNLMAVIEAALLIRCEYDA